MCKIHLNMFSHLHLGLQTGFSPSGSQNKMLQDYFIYVHAICPAHLSSLDLIVPIISGKGYEICSSSWREMVFSKFGDYVSIQHHISKSNSQSKISYEHWSDSWRLRSCGYDNLNLKRISASFTRLSALKIQGSSSSLALTLYSYVMLSCNLTQGNPAKWGPLTTVVNSVDHHVQCNDQVTAHSGMPSHVCWTVGACLTTLEVQTATILYVCSNHL